MLKAPEMFGGSKEREDPSKRNVKGTIKCHRVDGLQSNNNDQSSANTCYAVGSDQAFPNARPGGAGFYAEKGQERGA